jgi:hypothetical protein
LKAVLQADPQGHILSKRLLISLPYGDGPLDAKITMKTLMSDKTLYVTGYEHVKAIEILETVQENLVSTKIQPVNP